MSRRKRLDGGKTYEVVAGECEDCAAVQYGHLCNDLCCGTDGVEDNECWRAVPDEIDTSAAAAARAAEAAVNAAARASEAAWTEKEAAGRDCLDGEKQAEGEQTISDLYERAAEAAAEAEAAAAWAVLICAAGIIAGVVLALARGAL